MIKLHTLFSKKEILVKRAILTAYQVLSTLLLPVIVLALLIRARKQSAYGQRIGERLGFCSIPCATHKNNSSPATVKGSIVIHGASLGEISALKTFIEHVIKKYPQHIITVTSFTPAGSSQIQKLFGSRVNHTYLPIDSPLCNSLFLNRLKPNAIVFMETELWPSLIAQAHKRGIKLLLINARLSPKSVRHYQKIRLLIQPALKRFNRILTQSDDNKAHFLQLGAAVESTQTIGNLKYDLQASNKTHALINELQQAVKHRPIWVVGSSHEDEEALILSAFNKVRSQHPSALLVLAPRHSERFEPIAAQLRSQGLTFIKRSQQLAQGHHNLAINNDTHVWLIDTIGELLAFYAIATVCTVAGSFGKTGGHNPLEPALFGKAVTLGPNMQNAAQLTAQLLAANAIIQQQNSNSQTLAKHIIRLLSSPKERENLGNNAHTLLQSNQGATQKAVQALAQLIP